MKSIKTYINTDQHASSTHFLTNHSTLFYNAPVIITLKNSVKQGGYSRLGRGSGRRGFNFPGFRLGKSHQWIAHHAPIFPQWLRVDPQRFSFSRAFQNISSGAPEGLPYFESLSWLKRTHHGLLHLFCLPPVLDWLIVPLNSCKSYLNSLKLLYLQYTSHSVNIRDIKSFPPLVKVWKQRLKGDKFKTTLGAPTFQVMTNLTPFEGYRQAGRFAELAQLAIATLTQATEGGEV